MDRPNRTMEEKPPKNPSASSQRRNRFQIRLTSEQKDVLRRSAALDGRSLTDFVVSAAHAAAVATIERHGVIALTAWDSLVFAEALTNPPAPNARLRAAAGRHRDLIAG